MDDNRKTGTGPSIYFYLHGMSSLTHQVILTPWSIQTTNDRIASITPLVTLDDLQHPLHVIRRLFNNHSVRSMIRCQFLGSRATLRGIRSRVGSNESTATFPQRRSNHEHGPVAFGVIRKNGAEDGVREDTRGSVATPYLLTHGHSLFLEATDAGSLDIRAPDVVRVAR